MSDTLKAPSSHQLRAELHEMVRKDLLGPAGGPTEEVDGRYIVGPLAPSGQSLLPDEADRLLATARSLREKTGHYAISDQEFDQAKRAGRS